MKIAQAWTNSDPLWLGPCSDDKNRGGVTQSLLSRWLTCRERARIYLIEGLRAPDYFEKKIEYGSMWHLCEEALGNYLSSDGAKEEMPWIKPVEDYTLQLCKKYPLVQEQIQHWKRVCLLQFPEYVKYWADNEDEVHSLRLMSEQVFCIPYRLPSSRVVYLRGKFDGVDLIDDKVYLFETKTKGDIDEEALKRQLGSGYDLQTMLYLRSLLSFDHTKSHSLGGFRYNVIRRPLSGGKGSIRQGKRENTDDYYERVGEYIKAEPSTYFMRWRISVTSSDIDRFRKNCLDPILENLCDWYEDIRGRNAGGYKVSPSNWVTPFGLYNPVAEGGFSDIDSYLLNGSAVGLRRAMELFQELKV